MERHFQAFAKTLPPPNTHTQLERALKTKCFSLMVTVKTCLSSCLHMAFLSILINDFFFRKPVNTLHIKQNAYYNVLDISHTHRFRNIMSEETSDHAFFLINIIAKVIGSLLIVRIVL